MDKPFHLLTPEEKTILRIAQNRAIAEKVKTVPPAKSTRGSARSSSSSRATSSSPSPSSNDFTRSTPEDHVGSVIRKLQA